MGVSEYWFSSIFNHFNHLKWLKILSWHGSKWILLYVAFYTIGAITRQKKAQCRDYAPLLSNDSKGSFKCIGTIESTKPSRHLNSLEHCICTTSMTNTRPELEPSTYEFRVTTRSNESHGGQPLAWENTWVWVILINEIYPANTRH